MKLLSSLFSQTTQAKLQKHWDNLSPAAKRMVEDLGGSATEYQKMAIKHLARQRNES